ncbi:MAG: alanine racemase [bacterium]
MYIFILMDGSKGRVWVEIYLDHLVNNYKIIKKRVKKAKIMAAIKADAYGHGAIEVARILESKGVYMFGVASVEEGIELRQVGIASKILILSPILYTQIDAVIKYDFMPTISEFQFFKMLDKKLRAIGKPIQVHIEVDTGMTRTGIPYDNARESIGKMNSSLNIKIDGIFSHFPLAGADGAFTKKQIKKFRSLITDLRRYKINPPCIHLANSSGIFKHTDSHFNLVRPGIALYGLTSSPDVHYTKGLSPVMALKSRVVNIRNAKTNTPVSYNHTFVTKRKSRIATISVGYGDGYPRALSNVGEVLVRGVRAPIIGTICMDLIMVDVTDIQGVKVGDIVTLIGKDGNEEIRVEECANKSHTIVYEITSGIGPRVARVFKYNDRFISVRNLLGRWRYGR